MDFLSTAYWSAAGIGVSNAAAVQRRKKTLSSGRVHHAKSAASARQRFCASRPEGRQIAVVLTCNTCHLCEDCSPHKTVRSQAAHLPTFPAFQMNGLQLAFRPASLAGSMSHSGELSAVPSPLTTIGTTFLAEVQEKFPELPVTLRWPWGSALQVVSQLIADHWWRPRAPQVR